MSEHLVADFYGCERNVLVDAEFIEKSLVNAVAVLGATVLETCVQEYSPKGVTVVLVLAESHISIHTWPEQKFAALDIYTCGDRKTIETYEYLKSVFRPDSDKAVIVERGPNGLNKGIEIAGLKCEEVS